MPFFTNGMNLLPNTEKEDLKKGLKIRAIIASSFFVAATFFIGFILLLPSYFLTLGNFYKTGKESFSLNEKNDDSAKTLLNIPSEVNLKLKFLELNSRSFSVFDSFSNVLAVLPEGVTIDSVLFSRNQANKGKTGSTILISGIAQTRDSLVSFSNLLKESNFFSNVDVPVSSLTKDKDLPFSINIFIENQDESR